MDESDLLFILRRIGMRKAAFCVIPKVEGLLPPDGLSWKCGLRTCTKICGLTLILVEMDESNKNLTWRRTYVCDASLWFVFRMKTICIGVRRWGLRNSLIMYWDRLLNMRGTICCKPWVSVFICYRLWYCVYLTSTIILPACQIPTLVECVLDTDKSCCTCYSTHCFVDSHVGTTEPTHQKCYALWTFPNLFR